MELEREIDRERERECAKCGSEKKAMRGGTLGQNKVKSKIIKYITILWVYSKVTYANKLLLVFKVTRNHVLNLYL